MPRTAKPPSTRPSHGAHTSSLRLLSLLIALTTAPACGPVPAPPPPRSPPAPLPSAATLLEWALGADDRGDMPGTADAYLLLLPLSKDSTLDKGTRLTSGCFGATSLLPGPLGDPRIFLLIDDALHVIAGPGKEPARLENNDKSLRLTRLVAFHAAASPLQILASVLPTGAAEEEIWSFTVADNVIVGREHVTENKRPRTAEEFFATYSSPRCLAGGRRCLALTRDGVQKFIDVQASKSTPNAQTLLALGRGADVRDIARVPGQEMAVYLLMGCPDATGSAADAPTPAASTPDASTQAPAGWHRKPASSKNDHATHDILARRATRPAT